MTSCMSSMRSNQLSYTPVTAYISYHFSMCFVKQKYGAFRIFSKSGQSRRKRYARRKRKSGFSVGARRGYIILCAAGLYHQTISFHIKGRAVSKRRGVFGKRRRCTCRCAVRQAAGRAFRFAVLQASVRACFCFVGAYRRRGMNTILL